MRHLAVELARLRHRRTVVLLITLGIVGCLVILGFSIADAVPPSAADRAAAQAQVDQQVNNPAFQEQLKQCKQAQAQAEATSPDASAESSTEAESGGSASGSGSAPGPVASAGVPAPPPGESCEQMMMPKVEWFLNWSPPNFVSTYTSQLQALTMLLVLALAIGGITFAGADWSSGMMGTQLLYQPRRSLMYASKATAMAVVGFVVGAVGAALAWAESYFVAARWGSTEMVEHVSTRVAQPGGVASSSTTVPIDAGDLLAWALRAAVLVAIAAVGGYLLAMFFRSSIAALAVLAGYGLIGEGILRGLFRGIEPFLLTTRMQAWLVGPTDVVQWPRMCSGACEPTVTVVTVTGGGVYLAILLAIGLLLAGFAFARRDIE